MMSAGSDRQGRLARARGWLDILASVAMIAVGIVFLSARFGPAKPRLPIDRLAGREVSLSGGFVEGSDNAAGALVVFTDFQCPFCAKFADQNLRRIVDRYTAMELLKLSIRHLPLEAIHANARAAAVAATCAGDQGRFWVIHDRFFAAPRALTYADIDAHAVKVGLDMKAFRACVEDGRADERISSDIALATSLGIRSTPTILVGRMKGRGNIEVIKSFSGAVPFDALEPSLRMAAEK